MLLNAYTKIFHILIF